MVAATLLTSGGSTTDGTTFVSASITPTANRLVLYCVEFSRGGSTNPTTPTSVVGNSLTWDLIGTINAYKASGTNRTAVAVYRTMGASPSAGTITLTVPYTGLGARWDVIEFDDVPTTGTNGSDAVGTSSQSTGTPGIAGTHDSTIVAAPTNVNSRPFFAIGVNGSTGYTSEAGFTELSQDGHSNPSEVLITSWKSSAWDATLTLTNGSGGANDLGSIQFEIKSATAPLVPSSQSNFFALF